MLLFVLIFFMEMSVMLSFSPLAVEQLSDSPELPGFCGSSDSLFFRHLNLRLTTLTRTITTTTRMTMKLMTPKAATVSTDSDVGVGRMVPSFVRRLEVPGLGVASRDDSPLLLLPPLLPLLLLLSGAPVPGMCLWGWNDMGSGKERECLSTVLDLGVTG